MRRRNIRTTEELQIVVIVECELDDDNVVVDWDFGDWGVMGYGDVVLDIAELIEMMEEYDK